MISKEIYEIGEITDGFGKFSKIPQAYIDLTLSKVKNLYIELQMLNKPVEELDTIETEIDEYAEEKPKPKKKVQQKAAEKNTGGSPHEEQIETDKTEKPVIKSEKPKEERQKEPKQEPKIRQETKPKEKIPPKTKKPLAKNGDKKIVAEKFEASNSLNELIGKQKREKILATQLKNKPLSDIKSAISLNDKIRFIKDLFSGDKEKYTYSIEQLNNFQNLDQALRYLDSHFDFNENNEVFQDLLELVYRRYPIVDMDSLE